MRDQHLKLRIIGHRLAFGVCGERVAPPLDGRVANMTIAMMQAG
jgi:hypothetical protein